MTSTETESPQATTPIVGIGASAGGLGALRALFSALPEKPGAAFVVVMHLAPEHHSELASILGRETRMPVTEVSGQVALEPDHVYVIPPDRRLELTDSEVSAAPFRHTAERRASVDLLFRSLAAHRGNGFAVVLSGGGSDGAAGVKAVKDEGGVILVQDPSEAEFDSMPRAAIATGVADLVLPVGELAERLPALIRNRDNIQRRLPDPEALAADEQAVLGRITSYLNARAGHDFSHYKRSTVLRRVTRRMQVHGLRTLVQYLAFLRDTADEADGLFRDMLISVTSFFRDAPAWEALRQHVIPQLFDARPADAPLRVWVPGCATGEEAYSLAMLLLEEAARRAEPREIQLFASDLDERALAIAREGRYGPAIEADVSAERLSRFFVRDGDDYLVSHELRDRVLFAHHSLLRDPPFARQDLISCRNLLIYMERKLQEQVFGILRYALRPGGYLFLGISEHAGREYFNVLDKQHHIYVARELSGHALPLLPDMALSHLRPAHPGSEPGTPPRVLSTLPATHRVLLEDIGPPSVLVDDQRHVIHLSETAGRYLELPQGPLEQDITRLVRRELQAELSAALYAAFEKHERTLSAFVPVRLDGTSRAVAVLVQPRPARRDGEHVALVLFLEAGAASPAEVTPEEADASPDIVHRLREALGETRARLHTAREEFEATNEELRAANEELQSLNEEYRSTAEELETSKEELQSLNEELQTVNSELKHKLEEVSRAHNDLENLMTATEIPTLFLNRELCIQRFTPQLAELFSIRGSDENRPIRELNRCLKYETLEQDATRVLRDLAPLEREVTTDDGRWYLVRLRPYRTADHRIDGVVVTFVDFTVQKRAEQIVREARQYAESIVQTVRQPLLVLTEDLQVEAANAIFYETFGVSPEDTKGQPIWTLGNKQWDIPELRQLLADVLSQDRAFDGYLVRHGFEQIGQRIMLLNARRLDHLQRVLLAIEDITEREQATQALRASEEALRASEDRLKAALVAGRMAYWYWDPERADVSASDTLPTLLGLPPGELPSAAGYWELVHPDDRDRYRPLAEAAVEAGMGWDTEFRIIRPADGKIAWLQERAHPRPDAATGRTTFAGIVWDITARKALEHSLKELNQTLEQRVAERTALVQRQADQLRALASELSQAEQRERKRLATILHDHIQQLIVAARMQAGSLKRDLPAERRSATAEAVEGILNEALEATRSLAVELSPPILNEAGLIGALEWLAARMQAQHGFTLHLRTDSTAEPPTEDMRFLLFECVRELVLNAVKHAGVHDADLALVRASDTDIKVVVQDRGDGFDPATVNARRPDAMGFGLFSIQERLARLGGRMDIETAPGRGTRVTLILPAPPTVLAAGVPQAEAATAPAIAVRHKPEVCRVLIVDDQQIIREGLAHLFDFEADIEVVGKAGDGPAAIAAAESLAPDVVLMDVNLGDGMDGIEATRRILARAPGTKVIGLSMHAEQAVADAMREAGAVEYFAKGGRPDDLIAAIRACRTA